MGSCCVNEKDQQFPTPQHHRAKDSHVSRQTPGSQQTTGQTAPNEDEKNHLRIGHHVAKKNSSSKSDRDNTPLSYSKSTDLLQGTGRQQSGHLKLQRSLDQGQVRSRRSSVESSDCGLGDFGKSSTIHAAEIAAGFAIKKLSKPITSYYSITKELHRDINTTVLMGVHRKTNRERVIKRVQKSSWKNRYATSRTPEDLFRLEVTMLSQLDHPNILKICELFEDRTHIFIVSEALTGGPLLDYLAVTKSLSEELAAKIMSQVMNALAYCHSRGIVHKNLQMDSLILQNAPTDGEVQVIVTGFGSAGLLTVHEKLSRKLTPVYFIAPETLLTESSEKSDVWSCGVILHMLLTGEPPFTGSSNEEVIRKLASETVTFPTDRWEGISTEAIAMVRGMLAKEPAARLSLAQCIAHPWLVGFTKGEKRGSSKPVANALRNLKKFQMKKQLKQAVLSFMASHCGSPEEETTLTNSFRAMDTNGDGLLSKDELMAAYCTIMSREEAMFVVQRVMSFVDMDGSGFVDYSEFMLAAKNHKMLMTPANLKLAFDLFDQDSNGKISIKEFKQALSSKKIPTSDEMWQELLSQVDANLDGELDFHEFSKFMLMAAEL